MLLDNFGETLPKPVHWTSTMLVATPAPKAAKKTKKKLCSAISFGDNPISFC